MKLINKTAVPANIMIAENLDSNIRRMYGVAKATFIVNGNGELTLDTNDPLPIYDMDVKTRFGVLPKDDVPRVDPVLEVIVFGRAVASNNSGVSEMDVTLQIGTEHRALKVFGNRYWKKNNGKYEITQPEPFMEMNLTWAHAFGGSVEVEIDKESFVEVADPVNSAGSGFYCHAQIEELGKYLASPDGYPKYQYDHRLPNIEDPEELIRSPDDCPVPRCWATCDLSSGILLERFFKKAKEKGIPEDQVHQLIRIGSSLLLHRAHPDWIIPIPVEGATVELKGMTRDLIWSFKLPSFQVQMEVLVGEHKRVIDLYAAALFLMPDLKKFSILYRGAIDYRYREEETRSSRVRTVNGWSSPIKGISI